MNKTFLFKARSEHPAMLELLEKVVPFHYLENAYNLALRKTTRYEVRGDLECQAYHTIESLPVEIKNNLAKTKSLMNNFYLREQIANHLQCTQVQVSRLLDRWLAHKKKLQKISEKIKI